MPSSAPAAEADSVNHAQLPVRTKPRVRQFDKYPRLIEGCRQSITFGTGLKVGRSGPDHRFYDYPLLLNAKGQDHVDL